MEGNQTKMREALVAIQKLVQANIAADEFDDIEPLKEYVQIRDTCNAALSAPPRNCDIGTAEEQEDRFDAFCKHEMYKTGYMDCPKCPVYRKDSHYCKLRWAQMPYEAQEGGEKHGKV